MTGPLPAAASSPQQGGGLFSSPTPPSPTRCPSCGIKEATAVCRWCGCWKFGAQAVDAAFRNILAGKFWRVLPALLLVVGCATIDEHAPAPEGWPELAVREHVVDTGTMLKKCYPTLSLTMKLMGGIPLGCAWVDLCAKTCDIYTASWTSAQEVLEHERLHCRGHDHVGDDTLAKLLARVRTNPAVCR